MKEYTKTITRKDLRGHDDRDILKSGVIDEIREGYSIFNRILSQYSWSHEVAIRIKEEKHERLIRIDFNVHQDHIGRGVEKETDYEIVYYINFDSTNFDGINSSNYYSFKESLFDEIVMCFKEDCEEIDEGKKEKEGN